MTVQSWSLSEHELSTLDLIKEQTLVWQSLTELRQFADFFTEWSECQQWLDGCLGAARDYGFIRQDVLTIYLEACWRGGEQFLTQSMVMEVLANRESPAIVRSNQLMELANSVT